MAIPSDPGTWIQDNNKEPIKVGGATGLHARFKPLYDALNGAIALDNLSTALQDLINGISDLSNDLTPVGTILPFYDFDAAVTFNTDYFKYCDGEVIADGDSPINGKTLPDLSNRYLVGFGTEGGGDIDTEAWAAAAVGIADHEIDLEHSHTVDSHTHGVGSLQFQTLYGGSSSNVMGYDIGGSLLEIMDDTGAKTDNTGIHDTDVRSGDFSVGTRSYTAHGTGVTGSASPGTDNQLSSTQSIQPRSIRVRYIMRYK